MSHHGGYMQREGHERLPRRRTTRSMLRAIDLQTGEQNVTSASNSLPGCHSISTAFTAFLRLTSAVALSLHVTAPCQAPHQRLLRVQIAAFLWTIVVPDLQS